MAEKNKCKAKTPRGKGKQGIFEGTYILQEYLKKNTDVYHKMSLEDLEKDNENLDVGDKLALKNKLADLTKASYHINTNVPGTRIPYDGVGDEILHNARVVFEDTDYVIDGEKTRIVKGKEKLIVAEDEGTDKRRFPKGTKFDYIYYNHPFTYEELDNIVDSINQNRTLTAVETETLINKLKAELASDYYAGRINVKLEKFIDASMVNRDKARSNIRKIDRAIKENKKISIDFYGYNIHKILECVNYEKYVLNPYYIFANGNHFYLIAASDWKQNMSFWRVDLMNDIEILEENRIDIRNIPDIPDMWDPNLQYRHINMSYDKPQRARIKVKMYNNGKKQSVTFLVDTFGTNFEVKQLEGEYATIEVVCSPFGLKNWALQFADRVEVLPPLSKGEYDVRAEVIKSLKALNEKYGI